MRQPEPDDRQRAATLLRTPHTPAFTSELNHLASICTPTWIQQTPLSTACVVLACLYTYRQEQIAAETFAVLARRLVAAEERPGGPYRSFHQDEHVFTLNVSIAYFFSTIGKPLPAVVAFIRSHPHVALQYPASSFRLFALRALGIHTSSDAPSLHVAATDPPAAGHTAYGCVTRELWELDEPVRAQALAMLGKVRSADANGEIANIAIYYHATLAAPVATAPELLLLSKANIYCWIAYMLYDRILDDLDNVHTLSAANICMRRSYDAYLGMATSTEATALVRQAFDSTDHTNAWESVYARALPSKTAYVTIPPLPDYGSRIILADRSKPHTLGPLLLTFRLPLDKNQRRHLRRAWQHFLIAKQLTDDIHDWLEDFHNGQFSFVACTLLQDLNVTPGIYPRHALAGHMRTVFWQRSMRQVSIVILQHVNHARRAFESSSTCARRSRLHDLLDTIERSTRESLRHRDAYGRFLDAYRQP